MYAALNESQLSAENYTKAFHLRDRVSERERYEISASYYSAVTGEIEKAIQARESLIQTFPTSTAGLTNLGEYYRALGQYEKAIAQYRESLRLSQDDSIAYVNVVSAHIALNHFHEADVMLAQTLGRKSDNGGLHELVYQLAFLKNDLPEMQKQMSWSVALPGEEDFLLSMQSDTEAYFERLAKARDFSRRAVESAVRANHSETAAGWEARAALREAECGNVALARQHVKQFSLSPVKTLRADIGLPTQRANTTIGEPSLLIVGLEGASCRTQFMYFPGASYPCACLISRWFL